MIVCGTCEILAGQRGAGLLRGLHFVLEGQRFDSLFKRKPAHAIHLVGGVAELAADDAQQEKSTVLWTSSGSILRWVSQYQ